MITFLIFVIFLIILSSLRNTVIYSNIFVRNQVVSLRLLYLRTTKTMLWLSLKVGLFESLSQETTFSLEGNVFSRTVLFDLFENTMLCEEANNLPCLMEFINLH
jgi:hypothetical protein